MPLTFQTLSQQFVFVDPSVTPPATVNPEAVQPNHTYLVFLVIENSDPFEQTGVQVNVWHSAFGIGLVSGTSGITEPAPVNVPPEAYGIPGTATVTFNFTTPAGGHGCLGAQILPAGPSIGQNITVCSVASGTPSTLSFLVFGGAAAEQMTLTLTESVVNGAVIPAGSANSWNPLLVAPPGTGPAGPTASPVTLNLAADSFSSVGLQVTPAAGASTAHDFHIVGTVAGVNVGSVDIIVNPVAGLVAPDPFLTGGYQSPDILIFDSANNLIPLGGAPGGPWDTLLIPNTDYKLSVVVHNDSPTPAVNTVVRFWEYPGGVVLLGTQLDVRTVTVPGNGSVQVDCTVPFRSALPNLHKCAAVSIANSQSATFSVDPTTAAQVMDPALNPSHSGSAWRNTDSKFVFIGKPWTLTLKATEITANREPVRLEAQAMHVPANFGQTGPAAHYRQILREAGDRATYPLYLINGLREKLPTAELHLKVGGKPEAALERGQFAVSGIVPKDAKPGDVFLVNVSAHYPAQDEEKPRTVEFLEALHVRG